jgi:hypothetical protein
VKGVKIMATAVASREPVLTTPLLIALVTLKGYEESQNGKELYIKDLAGYLVDLKKAGKNISRIALSGFPGNYWSDDLARFVGEGIVVGDIKHKSPLDITPACVKMCLNTINEEIAEDEQLKPAIQEIMDILGLKTRL